MTWSDPRIVCITRVTREFLRTFRAPGIKLSRHGLTELIEGDSERQKWNSLCTVFFLPTVCVLLVQYSVCMRRMHFYLLESHLDHRAEPEAAEFCLKFGFTLIMPYLYTISSQRPCLTTPFIWTQSPQWTYVLLPGHWALEPPSYVWEISDLRK